MVAEILLWHGGGGSRTRVLELKNDCIYKHIGGKNCRDFRCAAARGKSVATTLIRSQRPVTRLYDHPTKVAVVS